ncbi:guanylate-binding protein 4 isoform X1 [Sorghum bicolor]|uniref:guanylate-binding protein 4 isoform X1 n=1 Tax=Sorghum bicolor TaxID=4558 RepID=UPI000B425703|nr:guanylate-binding protein 4 isoform X1 [Sorghum bicolor]|eukprot:XP_021303506.1 guanylate-binding protein 4 isoform X1 [Sorghum bicolor]
MGRGRGRWAPGIRAAALILLAVAAAAGAAAGDPDPDELERAFPIVEPDHGHTKLRLSEQGLEAIRRIETPIAVVGVIGPYRSGKSFLLNQLLSLSCDKGFGVGHMRDTKTKGIWIWGTPVEMDVDGSKVSVLYLDTEGFESVGKSNVYDDRIFALATVLSSVLIYNLPETVREADISRLSFAVEIAEEFYGRFVSRVKGQDVAFEPAKLLWLIQRDFLQGKSVQQMVNEALQRVPNDNGDKYIDEVNQIRDSLAVMGNNSTAFSLPQPHLQRTKLCDMEDKELEPLYVKRREQLKQLVSSIVKPKIVQGRTLNGKDFASFLQQILEALNKGEIPSTGSLVEIFNKAILDRCLKVYREKMDGLGLPVPVDELQKLHEMANGEARILFDKQHFGKHHAAQSALKLEDEIKKVYRNVLLANEYQSSKLCEARFSECEDKMDHLQVLKLPSMAKFNAGFTHCNQSFVKDCVGPAKESYERRMSKMLAKSRALFIKEYNNKLFNWLVTFSLVMVVIGRFVIKFFLLEIVAWVMFIFLETYTRMFWSAESLYYNPAWHIIVSSWEIIVYSPILDLDRWAIPIVIMLSFGVFYWRCFGGRRKRGRGSLLPLYKNSYKNSSRSRSD